MNCIGFGSWNWEVWGIRLFNLFGDIKNVLVGENINFYMFIGCMFRVLI